LILCCSSICIDECLELEPDLTGANHRHYKLDDFAANVLAEELPNLIGAIQGVINNPTNTEIEQVIINIVCIDVLPSGTERVIM